MELPLQGFAQNEGKEGKITSQSLFGEVGLLSYTQKSHQNEACETPTPSPTEGCPASSKWQGNVTRCALSSFYASFHL